MVLIGSMVASTAFSAHGQTGVFGTGMAGATYTDNLYFAGENPFPGTHGRMSVWYVTLAPGLGLYHNGRTSRYLLEYRHGFTFFFGHPVPTGQADIGSFQGIFLLSPRDELAVALEVRRDPTTLLYAAYPSLSGQPAASTSRYLVTSSVAQSYVHEYSLNWSGRQTSRFALVKPIGGLPQPLRFNADVSFGARYRLERDAWDFDMLTDYYETLAAGTGATRQPESRYFAFGPRARWRRDLSAEWNSGVYGGAQIYWFQTGHSASGSPITGASLNWHRETASATLTYDALLSPNLFTNRVYFTNSLGAQLQVGLIPDYHVTGLSSSIITMNYDVATGGSLSSTVFYLWASSAGINWAPDPWPTFSLAFQHVQQFGRGTGTTSTTTIPDFYVNQVMLTVHGRFPATDVAPILLEPSVRVDEADRPPDTLGLDVPEARPETAPEKPSGSEGEPGTGDRDSRDDKPAD
jgi:hypothetical protein